jgi:GDP-L-fucose synthase
MILVTGATGFVGGGVCHMLERQGRPFTAASRSLGVDLRDRGQARALFEEVQPEAVINCAAFVGGIQFGYDHPVRIYEDNLLITLNLLQAATAIGVRRFVNPISNCAYPADATVFREREFWDGPLHESVLVYGFVRKASWVGSWAYRKEHGLDVLNLILSNMYGPGDHFEPKRSHALGALIAKIVEAKREGRQEVVIWGTGKPVREWLFIDDGAEALVRGLDCEPSEEVVNVGVKKGVSIANMARMIADEVDYEGGFVFDTERPDGAAYKTVDGTCGEALLGWSPSTDLREGIRTTVAWFENNRGAAS